MAGQEFALRDRIVDQQGTLGAYVPSRRSVVTSRRSRRPKEVRHAAFARYVFLHYTSAGIERSLGETRIDARLLRIDGMLVQVRGREVARLWEAERKGFLDNLPEDSSLQFTAGGTVEIIAGPFVGTMAAIAETPKAWSEELAVWIGGIKARMPLKFFELVKP